ncbi:capsular exopolysaccharide synthesis family protein [Novosphingobium sp. 1748]|uniref:GumC family protein n=1 Tax=Novosphingobium sp. 1748 TaxID=2817760 RepID=UPI002861A29D|nr:polysaccharide biosynthesis tyrosine autokinase [Novosphingobium sp. 1748]MDR6709868.1 capsular exopolysaccharide synthesis family protein [Novosphingobium sp. 1748]
MANAQEPSLATSLIDRFLPNFSSAEPLENNGITMSEIRAMLYRQRKLIFPTIVAGPVLALGVTWMMPAIYEGTVSVKIDNERAKILEGQDLDPTVTTSDTGRYLATQASIVTSRSLATQVADEMALARDDRFLLSMGKKVKNDGLSKKDADAARREQVITLLQQTVKMATPTDNRVATISFRSRNPQIAAQVANTYADKYIGQNVLQRYEMNAYARKILKNQVTQTQQELRAAEQKAIDYARQYHLIDIGDAASGADEGKGNGGTKDTGNGRSIVTANLVAINDAYAAAQAERIAAEGRWHVAQSASPLDLPEGRNSPSIQGLMQSRAATASQLAQLRKRYAANRPEVQEAAAQLASIESQIATVGQNIRASIRAEYLGALHKEQELAKSRSDLSAQSLGEQERRVQLNLIVRDADTLRRQLGDLLTRLNQIESAADVDTNNIAIIDKARVPDDPVSPIMWRNLLIGLVAGVTLAISTALLRELFDETLQRPEDVEDKLRLPLLGVVPATLTNVLDSLNDGKSGLAEAYYSVRSTIDYASGGDVKKLILITSSSPAEGKSTTAYALAQDFARAGRRVLLVDADTRAPSQHRLLKHARNLSGLTDSIVHQKPFTETIHQSETPDLYFMPLGARPANPAHLLSSDVIAPFLNRLKEMFDVVIVDAPPVMGLADAPLLARHMDAVIFIAEAGRAHNGQAKIALRRLRDNGAHVLGAVLTKFNPVESGYGQSTGYYYYYNYRYERALPEGETA